MPQGKETYFPMAKAQTGAAVIIRGISKEPGVSDIMPLMARMKFAKALHVENVSGKTNVIAETLLDDAIRIIEDAAV